MCISVYAFPPPCIHECVRASQPVCSWLCLTRETTEYQPACPGVCVGVARRFKREKVGQRRGYSSAGPSLSGSGPGEKTGKKECAGRRRGIREGERFRGDRRMAEFPTLLFLPFSLSPGPAERVRRRVCSLEAEKERNFLRFSRFFVAGILPVLQTDVACRVLVC